MNDFKDDFHRIIMTSFLALVGAILLYLSFQATKITESIDLLTVSVSNLNSNMAVVLKDGEYRSNLIEDHEIRIRVIEKHIK